MMSVGRPISAALSPNAEPDDVVRALGILFRPHQWTRGTFSGQVAAWFQSYFGTKDVYLVNSGRGALYGLLISSGIGPGDEVLVPGFTCVAVPNSVLWTGAKPVYVDIGDRYNMDPKDAAKKITKKTKAVIIQHTFGIPADVAALVALARRHNLFIIEDCAHSLGATVGGKITGTFGDAAIFSFGRDKVLSSVFGGVAIVNESGSRIREPMKEFIRSLPYPSYGWTLQQLLHVPAFALILPFYFSVGKLLLVALQRLHLLSLPVYQQEKQGKRPDDFPKQFPNALAFLAFFQLRKLARFNQERRAVAHLYADQLAKRKDISVSRLVPGAIYLRFPIEVTDPKNLLRRAKSQGILLGHWYGNVIDPAGVDFAAIGYRRGSCPAAERAAGRILNLPTRIAVEDARRVIRAFA